MTFRLLQFLRPLASRARVDKAVATILSAGERMRPTARTMEARFLDCGSAIEDLSHSSESLVRDSEELVHLAAGRGVAEEIITGTMAVLKEPLDFLDHYTRQLRKHTESLGQGRDLLDGLLKFEVDLQAAVAPLRATRTLFRVEAARLPEEIRASFVTLADQIEALHNQVRDSFSQEFAKLSDTRAILNELVRRVESECGRQQKLLADERASISAALAKLDAQIELNSGREAELTARGRLVQAAVSRVVVALQNQDIVAQRTEHLFEGIEKIRNLGLTARSQTELGKLRALAEIQDGQAAGALHQLVDTGETVGAAVNEILSSIDERGQQAAFLTQFSQVTAASNDTVQVLLEIVDKTREMLASAVRLGAESLEQVQPVNSVTSQLSDCVGELSHQMNLVALNAQIQAVKIGEGTGLEVLAAHTAVVATETSRLGDAIRENLGSLRLFLQREIAVLTKVWEQGRVQEEYMATTASAQEQKLNGTRDATSRKFDSLRADIDKVRASAVRAASASQVEPGEESGFAALRTALSQMVEGLRQMSPSAGNVDLGMEDAHYTMASERNNHRKVLGCSDAEYEQETQVELF